MSRRASMSARFQDGQGIGALGCHAEEQLVDRGRVWRITREGVRSTCSERLPLVEDCRRMRQEALGETEGGGATDIVFELDSGKKVRGHRFFLTHRCQYLSVMLASGMREALSGVVRVTECSEEAFMVLHEFLYTGTIEQEIERVEDVRELWCVVEMWQLQSLKTLLCKSLCPGTIEAAASFACQVRDEELLQCCVGWIQAYFKTHATWSMDGASLREAFRDSQDRETVVKLVADVIVASRKEPIILDTGVAALCGWMACQAGRRSFDSGYDFWFSENVVYIMEAVGDLRLDAAACRMFAEWVDEVDSLEEFNRRWARVGLPKALCYAMLRVCERADALHAKPWSCEAESSQCREIAGYCCRVLGEMAYDEADAVFDAGGVDAVIWGFQLFGKDALMLQNACYALRNLAMSRDPHPRDVSTCVSSIISEGGIQVIVTALETSVAVVGLLLSAEIYHYGCDALACLTQLGGRASRQCVFRETVGGSLIVKAMNLFSREIAVQQTGCNVMYNLLYLAFDQEGEEEGEGGGGEGWELVPSGGRDEGPCRHREDVTLSLVRAGGVEAVMRAMRTHVKRQAEEQSAKLAYYGFGILNRLSMSKQVRDSLVMEHGVVELIEEIMRENSRDTNVQIRGIEALKGICEREECLDMQQWLVRKGAIRAVCKSYDRNAADEFVEMAAGRALEVFVRWGGWARGEIAEQGTMNMLKFGVILSLHEMEDFEVAAHHGVSSCLCDAEAQGCRVLEVCDVMRRDGDVAAVQWEGCVWLSNVLKDKEAVTHDSYLERMQATVEQAMSAHPLHSGIQSLGKAIVGMQIPMYQSEARHRLLRGGEMGSALLATW